MKKYIIIINFILLTILFTNQSYAATTSSPTPAPTAAKNPLGGKLDQQINQLKEKIASRVSELNLVEKRGIIGTVTEIKGNQITLTDEEGNTRFADVDEITKFSSADAKGFGLSDLSKGTKISVLGIYNKQSKRMLARFIKTYAKQTIYSGAIATIDPKNFQITVTTSEKKDVKVDIDTATKVSSYTSDAGLARYGFSKLAVGDRVTIAGSADRTDPNLFSASRVVAYLGLPKDPNLTVGGNTPASPAAATVAPTTPKGRNINPIR